MYAFGDMTHSCMFTFGCAFRSVCLQAESGQMACHIPVCGMSGVHSEIVVVLLCLLMSAGAANQQCAEQFI